MTTPSNAHRGGWGHRPHATYLRDHRLSRRQARRMSRRFAGVGVTISAARLRQIAGGAPAGDGELTDVEFAGVACELAHDKRLARRAHAKRHYTQWIIVTGVFFLALGSLLCMAVLLFSLMLHDAPF
ncbi:hypothetical protein H7J87_19870 [Mycolicibacterium wolinskyi]|uniref:Uncharacterized protein n=2 Tax=Mycobacteriaceae TaxID=1762 RepID=A0A1X2F3K7_9MYCO|nr:hypothetical protein [Mycolicibacterium wolinskyi]MCV7294483.1 hypothetical protein [Mycolicibacterium goodii]ORX12619.1 hypothetical protein AWC31_32220 [Mycolicibacterium wolinskyi]